MYDKLKLTIPKEQIESGAWEQIERALELPFLKTLAIMPDVHKGYDLPIGAVALLDGYVWPGAVGYDIGCGMCHLMTGLYVKDLPPLGELRDRIIRLIPTGFNERSRLAGAYDKKFPNAFKFGALWDSVSNRARTQLGTLGGGNHFIEIGANENGQVAITVHSGSRRPGWLIGDFYMRMTGGPVPATSDLGDAYLIDMKWAERFALDSRMIMVLKCLDVMGASHKGAVERMVNENHNHAEVTAEGILHRKGATPALHGQLGVIPANMRDGVYLTRGLGNAGFLNSASHGAGRVMGRKQAERELDADLFTEQMADVVTGDLSECLDEAPGAYKDIKGVLAAQEGKLVDVIDHFRPLVSVKG